MRFLPIISAGILIVASSATASKLDFNHDVRPILFNYCVACHEPDEGHREAKLRLDQFEFATEDDAIVPGNKE
ncbi:MAG: hypothetical protein ACI8XO_002026 [Verrucomicrobiales bacterium]|jgi:hypothetical protein